MQFGTARVGGQESAFAVGQDGLWYALAGLLDEAPATLLDFIALGDAAIDRAKTALSGNGLTPIDQAAATLIAPIPKPAKNVFCVGRNYIDHVQEIAGARGFQPDFPKYPQFFTKPPTAVVGPGATVRLDQRITQQLDYEVELAVVIGKAGRDIAADAVEDHIFGYTICNDVTARDLQGKHGQWFKGKGLDDSCPLGPLIVHKSALPLERVQKLGIGLSINGQQRQQASTADMIFDIRAIIVSLSAGMTLEPGDIIATGTPSGVGLGMDPSQFLRPGDVMRCQIEGLGMLENTIVAA
jgi:2-keto-4-pentenoate hydratase/2-oxohepta-3-ene-1,7-dioic acid hydratase in catechol pathway